MKPVSSFPHFHAAAPPADPADDPRVIRRTVLAAAALFLAGLTALLALSWDASDTFGERLCLVLLYFAFAGWMVFYIGKSLWVSLGREEARQAAQSREPRRPAPMHHTLWHETPPEEKS